MSLNKTSCRQSNYNRASQLLETRSTFRSHWYSACIVAFFLFVLIMTALNSFCSPQAHLLSCTVHCLLWLQNLRKSANPNGDDSDDNDNDEEEGYQSDLQTILESMTRRMIKSELEDFELVCI